jgi:hypothetical protein
VLEQLLSYNLEAISAQAHRRHTFGILLCKWQLQLVFHSRSYVVVSQSFDMRYDKVKLAVAFAVLWMADLGTLGFDPHFVDSGGHPAVRPEGCRVVVGNHTLAIGETLFRSRSLFGRGTATLATTGQVRAVLKINCPPKSRESEAELLHKAKGIPNIIQVTTSAVWGDTLDGFGPEFVDAVKQFEVQEFRILVLRPMCVPFTSIEDLEEFKKSFSKLVVGTCFLWSCWQGPDVQVNSPLQTVSCGHPAL